MKHILIVVDMQSDFVDGALGTPEAVAILPAVADKIKAYATDPAGVILVTYDTHTPDYMSTAEGKKLPVPHCIKGSFFSIPASSNASVWPQRPQIMTFARLLNA